MPWSAEHGKAWAQPLYAALRPAVVVEVGPGAGWWSNTLRPLHRGVWVGVEAWRPYLERFSLRTLYDVIVCADIRAVGPLVEAADLLILGDVLEHLPRQDAEVLVASAGHAHLLVSVPILDCPQGPVGGNPYETHLWQPDHDTMMDLLDGPDTWTISPDGGIGVYWRSPRPTLLNTLGSGVPSEAWDG